MYIASTCTHFALYRDFAACATTKSSAYVCAISIKVNEESVELFI